MALAINPNPYIRDKRSTPKIMLQLFIGLAIVWLAGIIYYFNYHFKNNGFFQTFAQIDVIFSILNVVICVVTACVTEMLFFIPKWKNEQDHTFKTLMQKVFNSYGYISGMILALILPVMINSNPFIHVVCLIMVTAITIGVFKMLFGGFGHNIFNVALVGRIFATICFGSNFVYGHEIGKNVEIVSSTILSDWNSVGWNLTKFQTFSDNYLLDLLLGNYRGTLGETFTLIILIVGIVLIIRKVIDWKLPTFYLGTCFITALLVGLVNYSNGSTAFEFALAQLMTGGIIFGAVFCITDPVTAPTNSMAKIIYAVFAGFLTMLIRIKGSAPEGVAYSILAANMVAPFIANFFKGRTTSHILKRSLVTSGICLFMILVSCSYKIDTKIASHQTDITLVQGTTNKYNVKVSNVISGNNFSKLDMDVEVNASERKIISVTLNKDGSGATDGYGLYFFGEGSSSPYIDVTKVDTLKQEIYTFDNGGISFDVFRKYDFEYYDNKEYKDFNDLSNDVVGCRVTLTISSYIYGINAVIDYVEGV